jgi:hypothetical protein
MLSSSLCCLIQHHVSQPRTQNIGAYMGMQRDESGMSGPKRNEWSEHATKSAAEATRHRSGSELVNAYRECAQDPQGILSID